MTTIRIADALGTDLRTRSFFRRDIQQMLKSSEATILDFTGVTFVSRSVADEIINITEDFASVKVENMHGDVKQMYSVVVAGRNSPRQYHDVHTHSVRLNDIADVHHFFMAL